MNLNQMRTMRLWEPKEAFSSPLVSEEIPIPEPGPNEIRMRVSVCGVCHTDLHTIEGDLELTRLPVIPGHQVVGTIDKIGAGVSRFSVEDRIENISHFSALLSQSPSISFRSSRAASPAATCRSLRPALNIHADEPLKAAPTSASLASPGPLTTQPMTATVNSFSTPASRSLTSFTIESRSTSHRPHVGHRLGGDAQRE